MSKKTVLFLLLFLCISTNSYADEFGRFPFFVCDKQNDEILVRFGTLHNEDPLNEKDFVPLQDDSLVKIWGRWEVSTSNKCVFKNGDEVKVSGSSAQAFPYGAGGGDPERYVSLFYNGTPLFYKKRYYNFREGFLLRAIHLKGRKLYECPVDTAGCEDVSFRFDPLLFPAAERQSYQKDQERSAKIKALKEDVPHKCTELKDSYYQSRLQIKEKEKLLSGEPLTEQEVDINNDGKDDIVLSIGYDGHCGVGCGTHYFDGNVLLAFTDDKQYLENFKERLRKDRLLDVESSDFEEEVRSAGGVFISLGKAGSSVRYVYNTVFDTDQGVHIYTMNVNSSAVPRYGINKMNPNNEFEEICAF